MALGVIGGQTFQEALSAALGGAKTTPSVIAAVGVAVGGAVTQLLPDTAMGGRRWRVVRADHPTAGRFDGAVGAQTTDPE